MSGTKAVRPAVERQGLDPDPEEARRISFKTLELILQDQERLSQQRVARRASSQQL